MSSLRRAVQRMVAKIAQREAPANMDENTPGPHRRGNLGQLAAQETELRLIRWIGSTTALPHGRVSPGVWRGVDGLILTSQREVAKMTQRSLSSVNRALRRLRRKGIVLTKTSKAGTRIWLTDLGARAYRRVSAGE